MVNFESCLFILSDNGDLFAVSCQSETISEIKMRIYLMMIESGRHSLNLWGPWLGLVA
jgi:hypothetical protein